MDVSNDCPNDTVTGTTTASYVAAVTILNAKGAIFNISNTSLAQTMYYKILGYLSADPNCVANTIIDETSLAAASSTGLLTTANNPYAKIVVYVKYNSGADTYQVDWLAY